MAGIGFVLRKLSRQDNLLGLFKAMTHSALASTGPWLFTILALGTITAVGGFYLNPDAIFEFRLIVIYNFAFSLVFSAPIFMLATRYLADCIHREDVSSATGMMIGTLSVMYAIQLPIVIAFYVLYIDMSTGMALSAIVNYMLVTTIWLIAIFLTALKNYKAITSSFAIGVLIAIILSTVLSGYFGAAGVINGFNIGIACIVASLIASVLAEYPYPFKQPFAYLHYFKKYWEIALGGFLYNIAVWVDKWVMWFSPESERLPNHMVSYPNYDSAMFLAYLSIIPSMAFFVFSIETNFFEHYLRFYRDIQRKATFKRIQENHVGIMGSIGSSIRNFLVLQGSISLLVVLTAPNIFNAMNINYLQIGIFRYGVLGAFFHIMVLFMGILLAYFDSRKQALYVYAVFLVTNGVFTYVSMQAGFEYYGYGYFLSSVVTFVFSAVITANYVSKLPFHSFITTNSSVAK